jgi:8-oxo-dGTP pyrophosphatase MutT (NUDIX family)
MHNFCCNLTLVKYLATNIDCGRPQDLARASKSLPLQVAAICYRRQGEGVEFLLVNTNGGNKWTFPKGAPMARLSHSQSAEREAGEEAGAIGTIEPRHFHLYLHSKGVFWQPDGVQEYVVKAFLMEVHQLRRPDEAQRRPTWFSPDEARKRLAKGREVKYARELEAVIDRALERIQFHDELPRRYSDARNSRAAAP